MPRYGSTALISREGKTREVAREANEEQILPSPQRELEREGECLILQEFLLQETKTTLFPYHSQ